jgi:hypothetical protein
MTADTAPLLALARECGFVHQSKVAPGVTIPVAAEFSLTQLAAFAERIRQDERERAARICENQSMRWKGDRAIYIAHECAAAIRSSGTSEGGQTNG